MKRTNKVTLADLPHVGRGTPAGEWFRRHWLVVGTTPICATSLRRSKFWAKSWFCFATRMATSVYSACTVRIAALVGIRRYRGRRHSLSLSWLVVRCARAVLGNAGGTGRQWVSPQSEASFLSGSQSRADLLFAYLGRGSRASAAAAGISSAGERAGQRSLEATRVYDYNWFNFIENGADPAHFSILHRADPNDGTWRSWFFNFRDIPPFDAIETSYGMKVVSRKPGPTAETEYVDEKSFALPSILQIGDTEFTHFKQPREALQRRLAQRAYHVRHAQRR